jgi:hypothetical protein
MATRGRNRRFVALAALIGIPALLLGIGPLVGAHLVRSRALPRIEERIGRRVTVRDVTVRWGRVELSDLVVDGAGGPAPLELPHATVRFEVAPLLRGRLVLGEVLLEGPKIQVVRGESGDDNISSILEKWKARSPRANGGDEGGGGARPTEVRVERGALSLSDGELGSVDVGSFDAVARRDGAGHAELRDVAVALAAGPSARAEKIAAQFAAKGGKLDGMVALTVEGGSLTVWKGFTLTGVSGGITPDPAEKGQADIDLKGGYGGVDRVLWSAKGWARPDRRTGKVSLRADRFDLGQLKPILVGTPVIDPELAEVDARLDLEFHGDLNDPKHLHDAVDFDGRFHLSGLSVYNEMLGPNPVRHLGFDASGKGTLEPKARLLHLRAGEADFRGVHAYFTAEALKLGKKPAFDARLVIAPVPCQIALQALPSELTPVLQGFRLQGTFKSDLHAAIDLSDLDQGVDLGGNVGIDGCKVVDAPPEVGVEKLSASFEHAVEALPGEWLTFIAGPENPDWVPYEQISPHLINSIMTTEDSTFMRHHGFIPSEFRSALKSNLEKGYFRLGASSITMQMVKNVLLSREKTLSRKLQELFLTWYVEKNLSKERILEIYFNVIEFGPRIYGIGRAARHYFGKPARLLEPREAAWFSSILPSPKRRYTHYCRGAPDAKWELYLNRILKRMHERGRLTDVEYDHAIGSKLAFDRAEALPEKECLDMVKKITAPPGLGAQVASTRGGSDEDEP